MISPHHSHHTNGVRPADSNEKDKTLFVDLTRYMARNKPLSGHKQLFKRFVHGEIEESFTSSDDEMNSR